MSDTDRKDRHSAEDEANHIYGHFAECALVLIANGIAPAHCEAVYKGLVELAESYRVIGGYQTHTAEAGGLGDREGQKFNVAMAQVKAQGQDTPAGNGGSGLPILDGEVVESTDADAARQRAYDALTPEQKRKFN